MAAVSACLAPSRSARALTRFSPTDVDDLADAMSRVPHTQSVYRPPAPLDIFGYDEYRDIRFRREQAVWRDASQPLGLSLQFFLASFLYHDPVEIFLVDGEGAQPFQPRRDLFDFGLSDPRVPQHGDFAFSGFRLHGPLKRPDVDDEIAAFNGASYFRSLGRDHSYGLSARGLAIDTIGDRKEEFPRFSKFWIERPGDTSSIRIHALLDSPSVTGAYHFDIRPGESTVFDVVVKLFPRREIDRGGFAPLTSMFLFDQRNVQNFSDFRSAVHDTDGLAIHTADGQHIWRPLLNPQTLQTTSYPLENPRGFGLIQRKRKFEDFHDLEAQYERRPSAWVEPNGDWGAGSVELLELPIGAEWGDNIVAYWRPREPMRPGRAVQFSYRLDWRDDSPNVARPIIQTRVGRSGNRVLFAIDYGRDEGAAQATSATVTATVGETSKPIIQPNTHTGGIRCMFTFDPRDQKSADLRLTLDVGENAGTTAVPDTEVWHYRWVT